MKRLLRSSNEKYLVTHSMSEIIEYSYNEGVIGNDYRITGWKFTGEFDTLDQLFKELEEYSGVSRNNWELADSVRDSGILIANDLSDENGDEPNSNQKKYFEDGIINLYLQDFYVHVSVITKRPLTKADL